MDVRDDWIAVAIGNSRLHWGRFRSRSLETVLHTPHLTFSLSRENLPEILPATDAGARPIPLLIASVVPRQTEFCLSYPGAREITLRDVPLGASYPTLGIDRALSAWGAGIRYGFPCLVIDAGTAITFTGVDGRRDLVGGAILPGLALQFRALAGGTAGLPPLPVPEELPPLWGQNTREAIESGIVSSLLAGMERLIGNWSRKYPGSAIVLCGGDAGRLERYWQAGGGHSRAGTVRDETILFQGMLSVVNVLS